MKVSGFTIVRNAIKFHYPAVESIQSILPICDEFIVNVGDSDDDTFELIRSIQSPKIRIIQNHWPMDAGKTVLSQQTNLALKECTGDWAFYLQSDEVIHEQDLPKLVQVMKKYLDRPDIDALRFLWLHFYGSYYRYRIDKGWFQKQDRIIRNNKEITSIEDAYGFARKDGKPLRRANTGCLLYHYGWVQPANVMAERRRNAEQIGFAALTKEERENNYAYGDLSCFHPYFGSHPKVMESWISAHVLSHRDRREIQRRYWWHPLQIFKVRYKTGKRRKERIPT